MSDIGGEGFAEELEAAASAEAELRDFMVKVGALSDAADRIELTQSEADKRQANLRLLEAVGAMLPAVNEEGVFEIPRDASQHYTARQIQASVVWQYPSRREVYVEDNDRPYPCYVVGAAKAAGGDEVSLLLLPARGKLKQHLPYAISVRREDGEAYLGWAREYVEREYTPAEAGKLVDPRSGNIVIARQTPGSMTIVGPRRKSAAHIVKDGELSTAGRGRGYSLETGITNQALAVYGVDSRVAKLIIAFGMEDKYRALLYPDATQEVPPNDVDLIEKLRAQNRALREVVASMLMASGIIPPDQIDTALADEYPDL